MGAIMSNYQEQIEDLKGRVDRRDSMRYPQSFRADAIQLVGALRQDDWKQKRISETLEIPWATLRRWQARGDKSESEATDGFRPVKVIETPRPTTSSKSIRLVSPEGWRVEGLTLTELLEVVGRLG
jgi:hypothetical protein